MTKQEQAAQKLKQAEANLKRADLEGKVAAIEAEIEKAEKAVLDAKDEAGRTAAQKELDLAMTAKHAIGEALVAHDELGIKDKKIELVLNGGRAGGTYVGRVFDGMRALATSVF